MAHFALVSDMYLVNNVGVQVADVPRSAPLKSKLMWPALALTAAMVTTQVGPGIFWGWKMQMMCWRSALCGALLVLLGAAGPGHH
jgi:hypothetical protein